MKLSLELQDAKMLCIGLQTALDQGVNLPYKWKYALGKNLDTVEPQVLKAEKLVESERIALAKKHSAKDDKGEAIILGKTETTPGTFKIIDQEAFQKELHELFNQEIEYDIHAIRVTPEQQKALEEDKIVIPGAGFRATCKIMEAQPDLRIAE
jgi:hypothetical protein